jgi:hypothetical protein
MQILFKVAQFWMPFNTPALGEHTDEIKRRHAGRTEKELP